MPTRTHDRGADSRLRRRAAGRYAPFKCAAAALLAAVPLAALLPAGAALADTGRTGSQIYVCTGAGGVPEYRNGPAGKGCKPLDLPDVVSVPAGRGAPRAAVRAEPSAPAAAADFPRVDRATQRQRDGERRAVLEEELRSEQARLATLRAEYNQGQPERRGDERNHQRYLDRVDRLAADIARSEANAAALRRELANLKE